MLDSLVHKQIEYTSKDTVEVVVVAAVVVVHSMEVDMLVHRSVGS